MTAALKNTSRSFQTSSDIQSSFSLHPTVTPWLLECLPCRENPVKKKHSKLMGSIDSKWSGGYWWFLFSRHISKLFFPIKDSYTTIDHPIVFSDHHLFQSSAFQNTHLYKNNIYLLNKKNMSHRTTVSANLGCGCFRLQPSWIKVINPENWQISPTKQWLGTLSSYPLESWPPFLGVPIPSFWKVV